ncbi:MAG: tripartite tricarboxylate transporter substrate binding protein [Burkholderiaceae bacterium]
MKTDSHILATRWLYGVMSWFVIPLAARQLATVLAAAMLIMSPARADTFPSKPIHLVVPYAPGGTVDILARVLAEAATPILGQSVIVENRPGAGGTVAGSYVARADPDGHILFVTDLSPLVISRVLYKNLTFDPVRDFVPVTMGTVSTLAVAVNPKVPVNSVQELIDLAKSQPGKINFSSTGTGSIVHAATELFKQQADVDMVHVPYKGGAPAVTAVMAGEVQVGFVALPTTIELAKAGKLRLLAVTQPQRSSIAPELPTVAESGLPEYGVTVWQGIVAPKGTPTGLIGKLNTAFVKALENPEVKARLTEQGFDVVTSTPDEFGAYIREEADKWEAVVKAARIVQE